MKINFPILGAALAFPTVALAGIDAAQLGHMKGILDGCRATNLQAATAYFLNIKSTIGDATKAEVDQATRTEEYQQAYQSIRSELNNMSREEMEEACKSHLGGAR